MREYFGRFGYVMDVYLPKAKENKLVRGNLIIWFCMRLACMSVTCGPAALGV